jgi:hypothetical protein
MSRVGRPVSRIVAAALDRSGYYGRRVAPRLAAQGNRLGVAFFRSAFIRSAVRRASASCSPITPLNFEKTDATAARPTSLAFGLARPVLSRASGPHRAIEYARLIRRVENDRTATPADFVPARRLADAGEDSKFEKLRAVLRDPAFAREKFIVFTEHRDTAEFLVRRLEGLGFTSQVALIHGGLDYRAREAQVDLFRLPLEAGGANYLVATDAAGEGINLQFCWLMVNYDVPWNPARLEQRMGRIHRYGQKHDPVIIVNVIAGETREGRVLKTLLDKLEAIRKQLRSDKVFDVVGRLFENVSLKAYLEMATTEEGARAAIQGIEGLLTEEQVRALGEREHVLFGGGDVKTHLPELNAAMEQEQYRRLLPGYVRRFVETAAPLIDLRIDGNPDGVFELAPERTRGLNPVFDAMESYPAEMQGRLTVYRPTNQTRAIWMHPGEPVFDRFSALLLSRRGDEARRGAIFVDPNAQSPYLFHLAEVSVVRRQPPTETVGLLADRTWCQEGVDTESVESRLIGLRQENDGAIALCPLEHLLLLRGAHSVAPGSVPLARLARALTEGAEEWLKGEALARLVDEHRARIESALPERQDWIARGYDYKSAELIAKRQRVGEEARQGDVRAKAEFAKVKDQQRLLTAERERRLQLLTMEPALIIPGESMMIAHALVLPTTDPEERRRHDAEVEPEELSEWQFRRHWEATDKGRDERSRFQQIERALGFEPTLVAKPAPAPLAQPVKQDKADIEARNSATLILW